MTNYLLTIMAAPTTSTHNAGHTNTNLDLLDCCLIGRLLINKPILFNAFKDRMTYLLQPVHKVDISMKDTNRFMFQFFHQGDMDRIYHSGPWLFDNYPLVLRKVTFGEDPANMPLDKTEMWVQVHNIPFGFMMESMEILLGNHVGSLVKYDFQNNFGTWRKYMRLQVAMKVQEPLKLSWEFERVDADAVAVKTEFRGVKSGTNENQ